MEDYIDILLDKLEERWTKFLGFDYFSQKALENHAEKALLDSLSEAQIKLFLAYEEQRNATASICETVITRQAFLLAKEIYS